MIIGLTVMTILGIISALAIIIEEMATLGEGILIFIILQIICNGLVFSVYGIYKFWNYIWGLL